MYYFDFGIQLDLSSTSCGRICCGGDSCQECLSESQKNARNRRLERCD